MRSVRSVRHPLFSHKIDVLERKVIADMSKVADATVWIEYFEFMLDRIGRINPLVINEIVR